MAALDGKSAVVTGGAGLLGSEFARALAREGANVVVNDRDGDRAEAVVKKIAEAGGTAVADSNPVESWESAGRIIETCLERFGGIDALVTCAQRTLFNPIWELTEKDYERTVDVHLKGHFACVHHAARAMREQRSGSIITVGSRALNGLPGVSAYAGAKGGILSATFSWALELAEYGVRVNCINPAAEFGVAQEGKTARHMQWYWDFTVDKVGWTGPVPAAESVAPLAVFLASDESDWVTGQTIFLSGDTLALLKHPREERFAFKPEGWSFDDLRLYFRETIGASLEMPGMDVPRYRWYDGVK